MVDANIARGEFAFALNRVLRLLRAARGDDAAELQCRLVEVYYAVGRPELAGETLTTLLAEHPYSEAAARAKDRWGRPPKESDR
jgi:hypothetical protein